MKTPKWAFLLFLLPAILRAQIANPDKPLKGEWDFKLEKVWEIDSAGKDVFGLPFSLTATEDGILYVYDTRNNTNYIFDGSGKFLRAFAPSGQGPGEIQGQESTFYVNGKVYIPTLNGIHIFTRDGVYIRTVKKEGAPFNPRIFLNEEEFISAPKTAVFIRDGRGKILRENVKTGKETVISEFSLRDWGIAQERESVVDIVAIGFSPLMILGYGANRLYWGMNTVYKIHVADLSGKPIHSFSLNRKSTTVSDAFKRKYFRHPNMPEETADQIAKSFPNEISFFYRIEIHNGLVYVFVPDVDLESRKAKLKQIDIFSPEGKYLYRADIKFEKNRQPLFSPLNNLIFQNGYLYAAVTDGEGYVRIAKYRIALPNAN